MILKRFYIGSDYTQGILVVNGAIFYTLERPWLDNRVNVSCIPPGKYPIYNFTHYNMGPVIGLKDVPGRSEILMHPGNFVEDSEGCILPGLNVGRAKVLHSRTAMKQIVQYRIRDYIEIKNLV